MTTANRLFKNPDSRFLEVECKNCHNKQIIFNKATNIINCNNCGKILAKPTGSKSEILTKIVRVGDENNELHLLGGAPDSQTTQTQNSSFTSQNSNKTTYKNIKTHFISAD
ncbi:MAG: 30S ribosomal protein S27e [Euryarchaeota archaeon HGW-Euryarchaeota-1]|nr:MAG: 30S ribosomal protein S27e [Euryarchaeota archaeon HGW-Euryarchaeota-1]